ncbi:MAG: DNA polymerase ligase N-terminal domain-containing protein [Planctomycetaceae bacterium]
MPRFAILFHDHPEPHWDFFLEVGTSLRTWRLAALPAAGLTIAATPLANHRQEYLTYEGPVSGDRGSVERVAAGKYEVLMGPDTALKVALTFSEGMSQCGPSLFARLIEGDDDRTSDVQWQFAAESVTP